MVADTARTRQSDMPAADQEVWRPAIEEHGPEPARRSNVRQDTHDPKVGSVSLGKLGACRGPPGLGIRRDLLFEATKTLSEYADEACRLGRIQA